MCCVPLSVRHIEIRTQGEQFPHTVAAQVIAQLYISCDYSQSKVVIIDTNSSSLEQEDSVFMCGAEFHTYQIGSLGLLPVKGKNII